MNAKNDRTVSFRSMAILTLIVGVIGMALQFLPDFNILTSMLSVAALGGLIGARNGYTGQERLQLGQSYRGAFEGLLLLIMAAYALVELSKWLTAMAGLAAFLNAHWPVLMLSLMCIAMGLSGLRNAGKAGEVHVEPS